MADPARNGKISRRSWLLAGLAIPLFQARGSEPFAITFDGDNLHVSAPTLHFLSGKPLARLKDGATVVFLSQLTLFSDAYVTPLRRSPVDRFVISYDIWADDKFSVAMPGARTAGNLSAAAAETWCQENLAINAAGLASDRPFWLQLEMRTADQRDLASIVSGPGISLGNLILLLGRKPVADDPQWKRQAGPLRLADLVRTPGRGPRNG
jgi:hypothetical protein